MDVVQTGEVDQAVPYHTGVVHGGKVRWLLHVRPYTGDSDLRTDVLLSTASEGTASRLHSMK